MKAFFIRHGVAAEKLQIFEAFDYLTDVPMNPPTAEHMNTVNICGNLSLHKCGCNKDLKTIKGVEWKLYGPNFDLSFTAANVEHMGEFPPARLPAELKYGFGLIWDGDSIETHTGLFGVYQRYIHSHKFSLYLASGLPVIVWSESGVADFVVKNRIGFTVETLKDIPLTIAHMPLADYTNLRTNARTWGQKLRNGDVIRNLSMGFHENHKKDGGLNEKSE